MKVIKIHDKNQTGGKNSIQKTAKKKSEMYNISQFNRIF
jgi:hypothetical protein